VKLARSPDGVGPRRDAKLAEDGPGVAVNGVMRQVELAADVAF
jgi:hypothetical protein